ncbi:MAG: hypothetical protein ACLTK0_02820 [Anaerovoracaceae bacterium]
MSNNLLNSFYIIITPVISLTLTRIMFMSENEMIVADALARIDSVLTSNRLKRLKAPSSLQIHLWSLKMYVSAMTAAKTSSKAFH